MRQKIAIIAITVAVAAGMLGASAYTSGSVDRQSNVDVVTDGSGLIGLEDGTSGDLVFVNDTGALEIDFTNGSASGVNTNATFNLGDTNDPTNASAFNITNNDAETRDISIDYTLDSADSDADGNLKFKIYDSAGNLKGEATEESSASVTGVSSGSTLYVVIVVDTHGLSSTDDLSGTLTISA